MCNIIDYSSCPYSPCKECQTRQKEWHFYHLSLLDIAIKNFKNQDNMIPVIEKDITVGEFIEKWGKL